MRKLDPAFGKVFWKLGKKVGSVFGKKLINLEKDTSVFEKLLKNLKTVGSVVGKC